MSRTTHVGYGAIFTLSLLLSWTLVTALLALAYLAGGRSPASAAQWAGLWFFTVAATTLQAIRLHRNLNDIAHECPVLSRQVRRDLARARFVILTCGSMCALLVFGLLQM